MRNRALHDQLRAIAGQAASRLGAALEAGAEIPFEVAENPGARSVLYHYRPLSGDFMRERFTGLRDLPAFGPAVDALSAVEGASAYLRMMGAGYVPAAQRDRAEALLREFLARFWDECTHFEVDDDRFERAYSRLEAIAYENSAANVVIAPLVGVRLAAERWELGSGLALERGDLADAPPDAVWASGRDGEEPNTIVALTVESTPQEGPPLTQARMSFRKLLSALRLMKPGAAALGPHAWWRTDDGPWQMMPLGYAGRSRGAAYWLEPEERGELTELYELLRSRPPGGALHWALGRFEAGCECPMAVDGLSDLLLAARALLEGGEPATVGVAMRLGALCAEPADQRETQRRVGQAFHLERMVMRGDADATMLAAAGIDSPEALVRDLEVDLRALLRDTVCGHLPADLRGVADEILAEAPGGALESAEADAHAGVQGGIRVERLTTPRDPLESPVPLEAHAAGVLHPAAAVCGPLPSPATVEAHAPAAPHAPGAPRPHARDGRLGPEEQETQEHRAVPRERPSFDPPWSEPESIEVAPIEPTHSEPGADWGFDDDASDYSAAV